MTTTRRLMIGGALAAPWAARAQSRFPERPVRIVVAYAAGGAADTSARLVAQRLTEKWGSPVVVENRPGGNTLIATQSVQRAPADGYSFLLVSLSFALNPVMIANLPYDPFSDFTAVGLISSAPNILVVHPSFPARTVPEFIAEMRKRPGEVAVAHTGIGTITHLAGELLYDITGTRVNLVAYTGSAPAHSDLLPAASPRCSTAAACSTSLSAGCGRWASPARSGSRFCRRYRPSPSRAIPAMKPPPGMRWSHDQARPAYRGDRLGGGPQYHGPA